MEMKKLFALILLAGFLLAACSANASASVAGEWSLVSYGIPASPAPAASGVETSIEFSSDGTLGGNVGCNGFGGNYKVEGDTITFDQIVATLMFCEGEVGL